MTSRRFIREVPKRALTPFYFGIIGIVSLEFPFLLLSFRTLFHERFKGEFR